MAVTLADLIVARARAHSLSGEERRALALAVAEIVELGPLAAIRDNPELARKMAAPTLHSAAERLIAERVTGESRLVPAAKAARSSFSPFPKRRRCGTCRGEGHYSRTCGRRVA